MSNTARFHAVPHEHQGTYVLRDSGPVSPMRANRTASTSKRRPYLRLHPMPGTRWRVERHSGPGRKVLAAYGLPTACHQIYVPLAIP